MSQHSHLYNDRAWRRLRESQLKAEPLCRFCKANGRVVLATVCDHITQHKGDIEKFWQGPFQSLCKPCHDTEKAEQEGRAAPRAKFDSFGRVIW